MKENTPFTPADFNLTYEDIEQYDEGGETYDPDDFEIKNENNQLAAIVNPDDAVIYNTTKRIQSSNPVNLNFDSSSNQFYCDYEFDKPAKKIRLRNIDTSIIPTIELEKLTNKRLQSEITYTVSDLMSDQSKDGITKDSTLIVDLPDYPQINYYNVNNFYYYYQNSSGSVSDNLNINWPSFTDQNVHKLNLTLGTGNVSYTSGADCLVLRPYIQENKILMVYFNYSSSSSSNMNGYYYKIGGFGVSNGTEVHILYKLGTNNYKMLGLFLFYDFDAAYFSRFILENCRLTS